MERLRIQDKDQEEANFYPYPYPVFFPMDPSRWVLKLVESIVVRRHKHMGYFALARAHRHASPNRVRASVGPVFGLGRDRT